MRRSVILFAIGLFSVALAAATAMALPSPAHPPGHSREQGLQARNPDPPDVARVRDAQIAQVRAAVARYRDASLLKHEGWKKFGGDEPLMGEHWSHPSGPDYVHGDELDFSRPSNLMYTMINGRRELTGVAFVVRLGPDESLPQGFAGQSDIWHVHDFEAALAAALQERPLLRGLANWWLDENYRDKGDNRGRLAMLHVWAADPNPDGVFADFNRLLPYRELGLPLDRALGGSVDAARGLHLVTERGCAETLDGRLWIADASSAQARQVRRTCETAADLLRQAVDSGAEDLNSQAERAWRHVDGELAMVLTDDQRRRIAAMSEHGADHH